MKLGKRKQKKLKKHLEYTLITAVSCLGLILLISGVGLYYIGFHNLDLGQNFRYIEAKFNLTLIDQASDFKTYTMAEMFIIGSNQMEKAFYMAIIGTALFSSSLNFIRFKK